MRNFVNNIKTRLGEMQVEESLIRNVTIEKELIQEMCEIPEPDTFIAALIINYSEFY